YPSSAIVTGENLAEQSSTQLYNPFGLVGARNWIHVAGNMNGSSGDDSASFYHPFGISIDPMGNIYIADASNHRIHFFPAGDSNGITIAGITGVSGNSFTLLYSPY
ncbi:unnamed protein product, partial [Rotaria sp. Silwood2]